MEKIIHRRSEEGCTEHIKVCQYYKIFLHRGSREKFLDRGSVEKIIHCGSEVGCIEHVRVCQIP